MKHNLIFRQLLDVKGGSSTFTYLLADEDTGDAVIIDPVIDNYSRDVQLIDELGLKLKFILETHIHVDHVTGAGRLRESFHHAQIAVGGENKLAEADIQIVEGTIFEIGDIIIESILTPGHTNSCVSYFVSGMVFTGDSLLIRSCGRTDLQDGSSKDLYHSIKGKLFELLDTTLVYPAHDYDGKLVSTVFEEKRFNRMINQQTTLGVFEKIMGEIDMPIPEKMDVVIPINLNCGISNTI